MFDFNGKQVMYLLFKVIEPKYFMLNGKNAFPGVTYENFLIGVINCLHFLYKISGYVVIYRSKDKNTTQGNLAELVGSPVAPIWCK